MDMKNSKGEILKAGCVVINKGKVLLVTTEDHSLWGYPKGHAESGETLEQVALRETLEETGYKVQIVKRLNDLTYINGQTGEPIRVAWFLAKPIEFVEKQNDEISEWKDIAEAKDLVFSNLKPYLENADWL
jgi:ADP-ribose pyrophosphatase YjhB (NUDIX family)